jgi:hypothetical protein
VFIFRVCGLSECYKAAIRLIHNRPGPADIVGGGWPSMFKDSGGYRTR